MGTFVGSASANKPEYQRLSPLAATPAGPAGVDRSADREDHKQSVSS
jgi:hypothetical protein